MWTGGRVATRVNSGTASDLQAPKTSAQAKALGTQLLGEGKVSAAAQAYELALELVARESADGAPSQSVKHLTAVLHANIAACRLTCHPANPWWSLSDSPKCTSAPASRY